MNPFKRLMRTFKRTFSLSDPTSWKWLLNANKSSSGQLVTEESSLTFSAVYACVSFIADSLATVPFHVYRQIGEQKEIARDHDQYWLLSREPHYLYSSQEFRRNLIAWALLWGNGIAIIERGPNRRPFRYKLVHPRLVKYSFQDGRMFYDVHGDTYEARDVIHIKAIRSTFDADETVYWGKSIIHQAREAIGAGLAAQELASTFYGNGTNLGGVLEHPEKLSQEAYDRLRNSFNARYSGSNNAGKVAVLEEGIKYKGLAMPMTDAQFLENRKFQAEEIARFFRVPLHKIGLLDRSTNNNIEHQGIEAVQDCLRPWAEYIEAEFDRKIFQAEDRQHYTRLELKGLLRGDVKTRTDFYRMAIANGMMTRNEARSMEDFNPIEGGDDALIPMNLVPQSKLEDYIMSITNKNANTGNGNTGG